MNRVLVAAGALLAGALLVPGGAQAQRGFRAGGFGGGRAAAIARPGLGGFYRPGVGAYRPYGRGYYGGGWRYPAWGYYGGALAAGLALGALSYPYAYGYPYGYGTYGYPYGGGYAYPYEGGAYAAPAGGGPCVQGPPVCTAAGYPNMGYVRRQLGAPF